MIKTKKLIINQIKIIINNLNYKSILVTNKAKKRKQIIIKINNNLKILITKIKKLIN